MKKYIKIYDVSNIIFSGSNASYSKNWNINGIPTGGLYKIIGMLMNDLKDKKLLDNKEENKDNFLVMAFDSKVNYRKIMYPDYKANREHDLNKEKSITQLNIFKEICKFLGLRVVEIEGYEADDIIYSYVSKNRSELLEVVSNDSDMGSLKLFNKDIIYRNPSGEDFFGKDEYSVINKICYGDRTDNVPPLPTFLHVYLQAAFKNNKEIFFNYTFNKEYWMQYFPNEAIAKDITRNVTLITPKVIQVPELQSINVSEGQLISVLNSLGFKKYLKKLGVERDYNDENAYNLYQKYFELTPSEVSDMFKGNKIYKDEISTFSSSKSELKEKGFKI